MPLLISLIPIKGSGVNSKIALTQTMDQSILGTHKCTKWHVHHSHLGTLEWLPDSILFLHFRLKLPCRWTVKENQSGLQLYKTLPLIQALI